MKSFAPRFAGISKRMASSYLWTNQYGDLQIAPGFITEHGSDTESFRSALASVTKKCTRGCWLRLDWPRNVHLLPIAAELGFKPHHVYGDYITLHAWRSSGPNPTPPYAHTSIGVSCVVVNGDGNILAIREKYDTSGRYHVPGGHLDEGEDWVTCGVREAREETGVSAHALGVCSVRTVHLPDTLPLGAEEHGSEGTPSTRSRELRSAATLSPCDAAVGPAPTSTVGRSWPTPALGSWEHLTRWGTGHTNVFTLAYAHDDSLRPDLDEVKEAVWVPPAHFAAQAHPHAAYVVACAVEAGQLNRAAHCARAHAMHSAEDGPFRATAIPMLMKSVGAVQRAAPSAPLDFPSTYVSAYDADVLAAVDTLVAGKKGVDWGGAGAGPVRLQ